MYKTFKTNSQNHKILTYLQQGNSLTCLEAIINNFSHNLRSRIADLKRAGYMIDVKQKKISGGYVAVYSLKGK